VIAGAFPPRESEDFEPRQGSTVYREIMDEMGFSGAGLCVVVDLGGEHGGVTAVSAPQTVEGAEGWPHAERRGAAEGAGALQLGLAERSERRVPAYDLDDPMGVGWLGGHQGCDGHGPDRS
jgi:hypothetical protein